VPCYVALLRGINVGGHQKISMEALRALVAGLGHTEVATYIQSGNVIFTSRSLDAQDAGRRIEARIHRDLGMTVTVLLRTAEELQRVIRANPFVKQGKDSAGLYVIFLSAAPAPALLSRVDPEIAAPDEFRVVGREIYAHYPNGYGRSKMTNNFFEGRLKVAGTARNWNTVTTLAKPAQTRTRK